MAVHGKKGSQSKYLSAHMKTCEHKIQNSRLKRVFNHFWDIFHKIIHEYTISMNKKKWPKLSQNIYMIWYQVNMSKGSSFY